MSTLNLVRPTVGYIRLRDNTLALTISAGGKRVLCRVEHLEVLAGDLDEAMDQMGIGA